MSQNSDLRPGDGASTSWGLGWQFFKDDTFGHGGLIQGYQAFVALSPKKEKGIVIVSNAPSFNMFDGQAAGWVGRDHGGGEN